MARAGLILAAVMLMAVALWRQPAAGQGAASHSKPGQEDLTFWVSHDGLSEIDVDGAVGFGDAARLLMRRRSNAPAMRKLRDRFVFNSTAFETLPNALADRYVIPQGRIFNLLAPGGQTHRILERDAGVVERVVAGKRITFDVRPPVRLRVEIAEPVRVYITASDGLGYAPRGAVSRFAPLPAEQFFHARESFEIELPAGETLVEAARGLEYEWASQRIDLRKPSTIRLAPRRWIDMTSRGYYSSDAHIHANYTADHHQTITPQDVLTYTLAEDLNIPNMMVANSFGAFIHDREHFTGAPHSLSRPKYIIWWNEEMRNHSTYGHMCLYGLRTLAEPLYTGFANTPYPDDYPPNYAQAKAARAQGGAVTYAHPGYSASIDNFSARELPVDLALGEVDAMDVMSNNPEEFAMENWYRLLNCGFRLAISAGTDSFTNVADHYVPGGNRVYVHTRPAGPLTYEAWLAGYKAGRSFATNGPMIFLTVNGKEPGEEIALPAGRHRLRVKVEMRSAAAGHGDKLELIVNGQPRPVANEIEIDQGSWIAARVTGPWRRAVLNDTSTFAHTSPVYVTVGGQRARSPKDAKFWADWIDNLISFTLKKGKLKDEAKQAEVLGLFRRAQAIYAEQAKVKP